MKFKDTNAKEQIHFLGIAGSGMAPLAELALLRGFIVSGSDTNVASATLDRLVKMGAKISCEEDLSELKKSSSVVFSSAIPRTHVGLTFALTHKKKIQ